MHTSVAIPCLGPGWHTHQNRGQETRPCVCCGVSQGKQTTQHYIWPHASLEVLRPSHTGGFVRGHRPRARKLWQPKCAGKGHAFKTNLATCLAFFSRALAGGAVVFFPTHDVKFGLRFPSRVWLVAPYHKQQGLVAYFQITVLCEPPRS